jgi:hypothetical protein
MMVHRRCLTLALLVVALTPLPGAANAMAAGRPAPDRGLYQSADPGADRAAAYQPGGSSTPWPPSMPYAAPVAGTGGSDPAAPGPARELSDPQRDGCYDAGVEAGTRCL